MRHLVSALALAALIACGGSTAPISDDGGTDATAQTDGTAQTDARVDSAADGGLAPDLFACGGAGECDIRPQSCCGSCGAPTPADMIAVSWQKGSAYQAAVCPPEAACPPCFTDPDPNLAPVCRSQTCKAVDVRVDDALSGCKTNQDCRLRYPGCCEPCGSPPPDTLIALSNAGATEYVANQCKPDAAGCPKCAIKHPPGYEARCNPTTLHCEVGKLTGVDAGN